MTAPPAPADDREPVRSPCTSVCTMDDSTGWCRGCYRTLDEIAAWSALDDDDKRAVLARLPIRARLAGARTR